MNYRLVLVILTALSGACGDNKAAPADADIDASLGAPTTIAAPRGGTVRALPSVTLTANQAATIYYTTDGTAPSTASPSGPSPVSVTTLTTGGTLKFFAKGSPDESVKTETYVIDRLGPVAVDRFTATANGADIDLAWTSPTATGFADVVVARSTDVAATVPTDGANLTVGDTVGSGKVVYVGTAMAFKDVAPGAGGGAYVAWARYSNSTYAEGRTASAYVEPAAQTGQIVINTTAGTATVTTQPTAWTLATSNYAVDPVDATKISFDLTATSTLRGVTFTPKLVKTGFAVTGAATATLTADGVLGADDVVLLGAAVAMGGSVTRKVSLVVSAPDTVTFDFTVRHDRGRYYPTWDRTTAPQLGGVIGDLVSTAFMIALPLPDRFAAGTQREGAYRDLVVSADGHWLYAGQRSSAHVVKIDTTTGLVVAGTDFGTAATRGSIQIALDPSGHRLYATFNDGMHIGANHQDLTSYTRGLPAPATNSAYLLEIDPVTMAETHRLQLTTGTDAQHVARQPILSRDGRAVVVVIGGAYTTADTSEIAVADLSTLALRDADPVTAGQQNLATGVNRPVRCAFSWTADYLVCMSSYNGNLYDNVMIVKAADLTMTVVDRDGAPATATVAYKVALAKPDGTFWLVSDRAGLDGLDPVTGTFTLLPVGTGRTSLAASLSADGTSVLSFSYREVDLINTADGTVTTLNQSPNNRSYLGHTTAMSPF